MSLSLSNTKSENDISFNSTSLVSLDGQQIAAGENYELPEVEVGFKCDYLKLLANISVGDTELTTDEYKTVTIVCKIEYMEDEETLTTKPKTICFSPKYQHEVNNKDTYIIFELPAKKIVSINMTVYSNEETEVVTVDKLRLFYSRLMDEETIKEMIQTGGGDVPVVNDLTVYNLEGNYTIDGYNKSLVLDVVIPDKYIEQYVPNQNKVYINWEIIKQTTNCDYYTTKTAGTKVVNGTTYTINYNKLTITAGKSSYNYGQKDGVIKVIARLAQDETVYGEATVEIKNSEVKDFYIKSISSEDDKLHTSEDVTIELGFLPEQSSNTIGGKFILQSYDGVGEANNVYGSNSYTASNAALGNNFTLRGVTAGRVSLYLGNDDLHKQFVFDVVRDTKTQIDYPDSNTYWIIWKNTSNIIYLSTFTFDTVPDDLKIIYNGTRLDIGVAITSQSHYKLDNLSWSYVATYSNDTYLTALCLTVYASNVDVYDASGNLVMEKTENYSDVDLDAIIYGE